MDAGARNAENAEADVVGIGAGGRLFRRRFGAGGLISSARSSMGLAWPGLTSLGLAVLVDGSAESTAGRSSAAATGAAGAAAGDGTGRKSLLV